MTTVLICLAAAFLLAGTAILFLSPSGSSHVTIRGEGSIVTVRSAARSGVTISFDPTGIPGGEPPAALVPAAEPLAEEEPTLLDEFLDPKTPASRRREIAGLLRELNYRLSAKDEPGTSPSSPAPVQTTWEDEACDEGLVPPEPDYYYDD